MARPIAVDAKGELLGEVDEVYLDLARIGVCKHQVVGASSIGPDPKLLQDQERWLFEQYGLPYDRGTPRGDRDIDQRLRDGSHGAPGAEGKDQIFDRRLQGQEGPGRHTGRAGIRV